MIAVALIGFGEVGRMLADELTARASLCVWDIQFPNPNSVPSTALARRRLRAGADAADAVSQADVVISAITAAQAVAAAAAAAPGLRRGAYFLDLNSASPASKIAAAEIIETAGARYVEGAVMAPVAPKRLASPMLLGGPHARTFLDETAGALGLDGASFYDVRLGRAAAAKLCRSVVVKGMEALLIESLLAARHYQVEDDVIASLSNLFPGPNWSELSRYMITRAMEHGARRAEEMRQAAHTVSDAGVPPLMSEACAERQAWAAQAFAEVNCDEPLAVMLDQMIDAAQELHRAS